MSKGFLQECATACVGVALMLGSVQLQAQQIWTLKSTTQRVLQVAPEKSAAEANIKVFQGDLVQAGVWPNPTVELAASDSMGKDDGANGTDINLLSISQPLPLSGRLKMQRRQADARLKKAEAEAVQQNLLLEYEAARVFHELQFSGAQLQLAEKRLQSADEFRHIGRRREQAGDLSRLERLRLDLIRESARQLIGSSTGKYNESLSDFKIVLNMFEEKPQLAPLRSFPAPVEFTGLLAQQEAHPSLVAARQSVDAAAYGVAIARANRFVDPQIWLAQQRDVLGNRRQNVTAFGVSVTVPLWNRSNGEIAAARANKIKAKLSADAMQRKLKNSLQQSHLHLAHLIEQGKKYRINILEPAEEVFLLTKKGFSSGQVGILNLVDAVDTYFNSRVRYIELLRDAWLQAAALRRESGISLLDSSPAIAQKGSTK